MNDIYCEQIIPRNIDIDVVTETSSLLAFHHTAPYWERHIVLVPKKHIESLSQITDQEESLKLEIMDTLASISEAVEKEFGGCRVSTNVGNKQSTKHLHWYVHAGKRLRNEDGSLIEKGTISD
ncbi:HIT family protein [Pelagicoccus mobilis]|uniref:HIT family protein n=1 Tax=Pelagicoccus mobilis TaxID=415221 RepID=A0A934S417_9BACT|nr:HIT family protein [Pelagicoccus mobilis]MBK1880694.1 HIT family protein [Pelagicoccus mobilis]